MGDKSPKSKSKGQKQKDASKKADVSKAKAKQAGQNKGPSAADKVGAKGKK